MITYNPLTYFQIDEIVSMMQDFYSIDHYPIDKKISKQLFEEFINNENLGKSWIINYNDEVIGYLIITYIYSFEYRGKIAFLDELYIKENYRNRGIGSHTVEFIIQEVKKLNLKQIVLEVENHNHSAQKVYSNKNFVIHDRKIMKYIVE